MRVFVMRKSEYTLNSNPGLDVEDRWFPDRTSIERPCQKTKPLHSCSNRSSFWRVRIVDSSKLSTRLHPNWTYGEYAISSTNVCTYIHVKFEIRMVQHQGSHRIDNYVNAKSY